MYFYVDCGGKEGIQSDEDRVGHDTTDNPKPDLTQINNF